MLSQRKLFSALVFNHLVILKNSFITFILESILATSLLTLSDK